jgi:hypothetical protein
VQVGALEESDAVGGRGLGDDERVGFHASQSYMFIAAVKPSLDNLA